jgi:hypothetical protein
MVKLKYPKFDLVSNWCQYNIWWLESEAIFADIPVQKPNITELVIN